MTGVIFDFNGTLFDDSDKVEKSWQFFQHKYFTESLRKQNLRKLFTAALPTPSCSIYHNLH